MVVCQGCGTKNEPDARFCAKCARKLDAASQERVTRIRAEHTITGLRWSNVIIALIVILILAIIIGFVLAHGL